MIGPRGYWLPREFHTWPEVRAVGPAALGVFVRVSMQAHHWDTPRVPRGVVKSMGQFADLSPLVERGLWSVDPDDGKGRVTRTMAELRLGRGDRGQVIRASRALGDGPQIAVAGFGALGLWALAASWSLTTDTPGYVPSERALEFGRQKHVAALWDCGLWVASEHGFLMHRGSEYTTLWELARDDERAPILPSLRQAVYDRDGWACVKCGSTESLTLDHIIPWSHGGPDALGNLQTFCRSCNSSKGARV